MKFDFSDFSKKRSQLMGISMLLIMIFHCGLYLNSRYTPFCVVGVDFFLVISAIGLFFSLSKNQDKLSFYKKRVLRILPTYLIVAAPYFAHNQKFEIGNYLFNLSGLCIIDDQRYFWFIGQILICYLLAPFYFGLMKYKLSILIPFITLIVCHYLGLLFPTLAIMLNRFAIFFLGFHLAALVYNKKVINSWLILPVCVLSIVLIPIIGNMQIYEGYQRIAYFFLSIPALAGMVMLLNKCPSVIDKCLVFVGGITLEIYLLHERICLRAMQLVFGPLLGAVLSIPLCIVLAYLLCILMRKINHFLFSSDVQS